MPAPPFWRMMTVATASVLAACSTGQAPHPTAQTAAEPTVSRPAGTTTSVLPVAAAPTTTTLVSSLPLGDGRRSAVTAAAGSVLTCQATFGPAGGAFRDGPWIRGDGTWDPTVKLHVLGAVPWPQAEHTVRVEGANRVITTNGVPSTGTTGVFPVAADDPAYQYDRNPNSVLPRPMTFTVPAHPEVAASPSCVNMGAIGVLDDGVVLFNALDAQGRDAAAHEVLDGCEGHPERTGQYHHHTVPSCLMATVKGGSARVGFALDGFGIYVERGPDGSFPTDADLDVCHGRTSPVAWDGGTVSMYHYVATLEYPYTVGCLRGARAMPARP